MNKFSQRIRECRLAKNISRKNLANCLFVSERLISYWENGKRECDFDTLIKIANYFDITIDYLLGNSDF